MKEKDLIEMFPDATRGRKREKPEVDETSDSGLVGVKLLATILISCAIVLALICLVVYMGIKHDW